MVRREGEWVCEPAGDEEGEGGESGEDVVFLTRGEGEEEQDEGGPEDEEERAAALSGRSWRRSWLRKVWAWRLPERDGPGGGFEDEGGPRHEPEEAEAPEEPEGAVS